MDKTSFTKTLQQILNFIYGKEEADLYAPQFLELTEKELTAGERPAVSGPVRITHKDALLISYGDMLSEGCKEQAEDEEQAVEKKQGGVSGLQRLFRFLEKRSKGQFSFLHILPFHPYSSDDGFSVIDYRQVDQRFGSWEDIELFKTLPGTENKLKPAFDFVVNHGSVQSSWFKAFLRDEEPYRSWYITRPAGYDYSSVVRPRTHPLLTPFEKKSGETVYVWTTFSADQVDYDFSNPQVLLEFVRILLEYCRRGAGIVRLDAIAYLWKEDHSPCIHHPKTHAVVKLFRALVDYLNIPLIILTETNVPHKENISYFGGVHGGGGNTASDSNGGTDSGEGNAGDALNLPEAHMVYNFALPPLALYAALSGDAAPLRNWAKTLPVSATSNTASVNSSQEPHYFLNFLASHDGVGLTPARGLVDETAFAKALEEACRRGALVSYKSTPQGDIPYELNCSYASVVAPPSLGDSALRARAFMAVHGVLLSLSGLPALYFHSWIGSEAWIEGPALLGYNRAINREKPAIDRVERELDQPDSFRFHVHRLLNQFLAFRRKENVFDPEVPQHIPEGCNGSLFALIRGPSKEGHWALCIENLAGEKAVWEKSVKLPFCYEAEIILKGWETLWLICDKNGLIHSISSL